MTTTGGSSGRSGHTATLLPNGRVLVVGGVGTTTTTPLGAQLYDPTTGTWSTTGDLVQGRAGHTATLLPNGKVLIAGGCAFLGRRCRQVC